MATLGVPDIEVLKLIDVHLKLAVGVEVRVGNEEIYKTPSLPPHIEYSLGCI